MLKRLTPPATFALIGTVLLCFEAVGVKIVRGVDTGFRESRSCEMEGVCFETDAGDLSVLLHLSIAGVSDDSGAGAWRAQLGPDLDLIVRPSRDPRGKQRLTIHAAGPGEHAKFRWPSGVRLAVWNEGGTRVRVTDWHLHSEAGAPDNRRRAAARRLWFWALLACMVGGTVTMVVQWLGPRPGVPTTGATSPTPDLLVRQLVSGTILMVKGDDETETRRLQAFLTAVLIDAQNVDQALDPLTRGEPRYLRRAILSAATTRFLDRFDNVMNLATHFRGRLEP